jgi:hypothetical protein
LTGVALQGAAILRWAPRIARLLGAGSALILVRFVLVPLGAFMSMPRLGFLPLPYSSKHLLLTARAYL